MTRRLPTALALVACLLLAAAASAAARSRVHYLHPEAVHVRKASGPRPSISKVSPMQVTIGQKLVVYGKNFRKGAGKNQVFFIKQDGGVVITKAQSATTTKLVVTVPNHVVNLLDLNGKTPVATKIQLRVLTDRFGSRTKLSKSPLVRPASGKPGGQTGGPACLQATTSDSDGDGLTNQLEINTLKTDPCKADTDTDGVPDGYEYQAALDVNNTTLTGRDSQNALPCACKEPYPNPLDPGDASIDHDGDGLVESEEYKLNKYVHGPKVGSLQYSDGKQRSQDIVAPVDPVLDYVDLNRYPSLNAGYLSDDERDADNDGLTNMDECCYRMTQDFWKRRYDGSNGSPKETPYGVVDGSGAAGPITFPGVSDTNPDSDGDGILDGADDQDHDGLSNKFEVSRPYDWFIVYATRVHSGDIPASAKVSNGGFIPDAATGQNPWARVNPYNPCKPVASKTCQLYAPGGYYPAGEDITALDPETAGPQPAAPWLYDSNDNPWANGE